MTQDEIIRMAREAGFTEYGSIGYVGMEDYLERFAEIVAAHERETTGKVSLKYMNQQVLAEREACAKVCENLPTPKDATTLTHIPTLETCAAAIRARGDK